jgi:hypothetical protein
MADENLVLVDFPLRGETIVNVRAADGIESLRGAIDEENLAVFVRSVSAAVESAGRQPSMVGVRATHGVAVFRFNNPDEAARCAASFRARGLHVETQARRDDGLSSRGHVDLSERGEGG